VKKKVIHQGGRGCVPLTNEQRTSDPTYLKTGKVEEAHFFPPKEDKFKS